MEPANLPESWNCLEAAICQHNLRRHATDIYIHRLEVNGDYQDGNIFIVLSACHLHYYFTAPSLQSLLDLCFVHLPRPFFFNGQVIRNNAFYPIVDGLSWYRADVALSDLEAATGGEPLQGRKCVCRQIEWLARPPVTALAKGGGPPPTRLRRRRKHQQRPR